MQSVTIIGTGLIGASVGLALRAGGFLGEITGVDSHRAELSRALETNAISRAIDSRHAALAHVSSTDIVVLAVPVLAILDWLEQLAPLLREHQLVTDVGSTKLAIAHTAQRLGFNQPGRARLLPGHPMAGKESGGAALAEASLFQNAMWLFTPLSRIPPADGGPTAAPAFPTLSDRSSEMVQSPQPQLAPHPLEGEWRRWVTRFGARTRDLDPAHHDQLLAWVSHLPQFLSTAFSALLQDRFGHDPELREQVAAIGARALRETTRLGSSPYSMWRDIALTNTAPVAETLHALEQELAHLRENLRTPELREEFARANRFRDPSR